jgi:FADH2 O2-dependent halogenase
VGSGFAGSLFAMIARRQRRSVILLERGRHPRVVIGESSTPLSNLLLEELVTRYDLPALRPLVKWGSWQRSYPDVPCGLKRGFTFFHHELRRDAETQLTPGNHLLVAASPHDEIADTHWYRADFDQLLVEEARRMGAVYEDEVHLEEAVEHDDYVVLTGTQREEALSIRARFVVDATGPRGCLYRLLELAEKQQHEYPATQALYSQFSGVTRRTEAYRTICSDGPPYPAEDAAVHHIFDGGWIWLLHFNNGITSAGIAATQKTADRFAFHDGHAAWDRLLEQLPSLARQFADAKAIQPFVHMPQLSFRCATLTGTRWALLPSAAGFIDPLLSTGFPLTLLGVSRLAATLQSHWEQSSLQGELSRYATNTNDEFDATSLLIAALYANMGNFAIFRAISLLYFAAASFSETAKRLNKSRLAEGFLLHNDARFGPAARALLQRAKAGVAKEDAARFAEEVRRAIEPFDVAGLCREHAEPWYPIDARDLTESAWKVEATEDEVAHMLDRSGFYAEFRNERG